MRRIFEEKSIFEEGVYRAYTTDEEERFTPKGKSNALRRIFEEKSIFEEGVCWTHSTDEKSDLYRKSKQRFGVRDCGGGNLSPTQYPSHFHNSILPINTLNGSNGFIA